MDVNGATDIVTNANPTPRNPDTVSSKEVKEFKETKETVDRSTTSNNSSKQSQGTSNSYPIILATRPPINLAPSTGNQGAPSQSQPSQSMVGSDPSTHLSQGASGSQVAQLQTMLKNAGFDPQAGTPPDGKLGPKTEEAVKAFQKANGLQVDGIVGAKTKAALTGTPRPAARPTAAPTRAGDGFEAPKATPVNLSASIAAPGDVVAQARTELGRNAHDVKLGSDAIGKAMSDDVSDRTNCANFVGGALVAAGQITSKDMSANVDGLMDKLRKTGNYTESHSLADVKKGDVVAFDHAHVMICTGFDAKGQPTFIGSNNENKDGSQKISEGPLTKWFNPNSATLKAWENNVVIMHRN
jgi:putative peptidoglycan binding protein